jgi:hypothetical protein
VEGEVEEAPIEQTPRIRCSPTLRPQPFHPDGAGYDGGSSGIHTNPSADEGSPGLLCLAVGRGSMWRQQRYFVPKFPSICIRRRKAAMATRPVKGKALVRNRLSKFIFSV